MLHVLSPQVNEKNHIDMFKWEGFSKNNVLPILNGKIILLQQLKRRESGGSAGLKSPARYLLAAPFPQADGGWRYHARRRQEMVPRQGSGQSRHLLSGS